MDRFAHLTAFVAVADLAGFAPAARLLGLSPPAITRQIATLEEHLGVRLLQRTTRSVTLTDAGRRYLERARRILADLREADDNAEAERASPAGRLVVAAPALFGRLHVAPLLTSYLALHPAVTSELLLADRMVNLVEEGVDVAVRIGLLADSTLVARRLGETRRIVVASPDYLKAHGAPHQPDDLPGHMLINFTALGGAVAEWRFLVQGRDEAVTIAPRYVTNSADAAIWHAEQGGGMAMVLAYQAAEAIRDGRLVPVLRNFEPKPAPIQMVYPTSRLLSAKVRAFVQHAADTVIWHFE